MALTRKMLRELGLSGDQTEAIIDAHSQTVEGLKNQAEAWRQDAERLPDLQRELEAMAKGEDYRDLYEQEKADFRAYRDEQEREIQRQDKERAYRSLLTEAGVQTRRQDAVVRVTDLDALTLEDGVLRDREGLIQRVRQEWSDFLVTRSTRGLHTPAPPVTGGTARNREEILAIRDGSARRQAMAENPRLFGLPDGYI